MTLVSKPLFLFFTILSHFSFPLHFVASGPVKIMFEGIPFDVLQEDASQIFASYGQNNVTLYFDRAGRSEGKGHVIFENRADGLRALSELEGALVNGATLALALGPNDGVVRGRGQKVEKKEPNIVITIGGGGSSAYDPSRNKKGRGPFRFGPSS